MLFSKQTFEARADPPAPPELVDAVMATALAICETFCDRRFEYKEGETEQCMPGRYSLLVRRYPLIEVTSITSKAGVLDPSSYYVVSDSGLILRSCGGAGTPWGFGRDVLTVVYNGGFDPLPGDLDWALSQTFDALWAITPGAQGGSAEAESQQRTPAKISVVGVGSIDFESASSSSAAGFASQTRYSGASAPWSIIPVRAMDILTRYMNQTVIAGG